MARKILRERDIIKKYIQHIHELRDRIAEYEARFGMRSDQVHAAIKNGHIEATDDVCDWIMTYELLERSDASQQDNRHGWNSLDHCLTTQNSIIADFSDFFVHHIGLDTKLVNYRTLTTRCMRIYLLHCPA